MKIQLTWIWKQSYHMKICTMLITRQQSHPMRKPMMTLRRRKRIRTSSEKLCSASSYIAWNWPNYNEHRSEGSTWDIDFCIQLWPVARLFVQHFNKIQWIIFISKFMWLMLKFSISIWSTKKGLEILLTRTILKKLGVVEMRTSLWWACCENNILNH